MDKPPTIPFVTLRSSESLEESWSGHPDAPIQLDPRTVTCWLSAISQLHRTCASSAEFYAEAARFAVETARLDAAWVMRRSRDHQGTSWHVLARAGHSAVEAPTDALLNLLVENAVTQYQAVDENWSLTAPQEAVVISPVLARDGELVAAIVAARNTSGSNRRRGIRPLEARLIHILAESVGVGIARQEQEIAAMRTRMLLEHAFSPAVVEHILHNPTCLAGQPRDVTMLFADIRGFTTLAESVSPCECYQLLGDAMEAMTDVVRSEQGLVVDYYGDGLLALWNAPLEQTDHADRACRAAFAMLDVIKAVSQNWRGRIGIDLELGIGIHSGTVLVGNAGTKDRIKYGPRGANVNLAHRVQAATKSLGLPLLVSRDTKRLLSKDFFTVRTCTARLPGLEQPVDLFAVYPAVDATRLMSKVERYETALAAFENGNLDKAEILLNQLSTNPAITPANFLAAEVTKWRHVALGRRASDGLSASPANVIEIG